MNLAAIRTELAGVIRDGVAGLNVYDVITPSPQLPAAHIGPPISINYHTKYATERNVRLRVLLEVSRTDHRTAQRTLDGYLSWPGVPSILEAHDATNWSALNVEAVSEPTASTPEETPSLTVALTVNITT